MSSLNAKRIKHFEDTLLSMFVHNNFLNLNDIQCTKGNSQFKKYLKSTMAVIYASFTNAFVITDLQVRKLCSLKTMFVILFFFIRTNTDTVED